MLCKHLELLGQNFGHSEKGIIKELHKGFLKKSRIDRATLLLSLDYFTNNQRIGPELKPFELFGTREWLQDCRIVVQ